MTYERKLAEAEALVRDPAPAPRDYPFLVADVGITGDTLAGVAALVRQRAAEWTRHAVAIEAARLAAKQRIQDAASPRDLREAARVSWPG
jgi:adenine/guanine phosphoribosyltransferase-like PRPP-binding protein